MSNEVPNGVPEEVIEIPIKRDWNDKEVMKAYMKEYMKEYRKKNKEFYEKEKKYVINYRKDRYANDPEYKEKVKQQVSKSYHKRKQEKSLIEVMVV